MGSNHADILGEISTAQNTTILRRGKLLQSLHDNQTFWCTLVVEHRDVPQLCYLPAFYNPGKDRMFTFILDAQVRKGSCAVCS